MKSNSAIIALSILLNLAQHVASADDRSNSIDVKKLEAVCSDLLDKPFLSPRWDKLQPYLRTTQALKSVRVVCSGSCSGSVALRGGLWLNFIYVNVPLMSEPWRSKECIVYSVTLRDSKRDIFHRETEPKLISCRCHSERSRGISDYLRFNALVSTETSRDVSTSLDITSW